MLPAAAMPRHADASTLVDQKAASAMAADALPFRRHASIFASAALCAAAAPPRVCRLRFHDFHCAILCRCQLSMVTLLRQISH